MNNLENYKKLLKEDLLLLEKSLEVFNFSRERVLKIDDKKEFSDVEMIEFEAFSSRFARVVDILTQKIVKNIFIIMQEDAKTFIDRCNLLEKLEIIESSDLLYNIRSLRNEIAHEYRVVEIKDLYKNIVENSIILIEIIEKIKQYILKKRLI